MDATGKARLALNLSNAPRMFSTWAMTLAGALGTIWFALPPEQQRTLLEHSPLPMWSYPIVLTAIGVVGRMWPQRLREPPA